MRALARAYDRLPVGTLVRRAAGLGTGAAIGQAAVVGATPVLARMYDKEDFGALAVFLAASGVAIVVSSLRYEQAILVAEEDREAGAVVKISAGLVVLTVLATAVLALAGGPMLAEATSTPELERLLWLLPPVVGLGGAHQILVAWATRVGAFRSLSQSKAAVGISLAASQILLGWWIHGPVGLVAGVGVSWLVGIVFLLPAASGMGRAGDHEAMAVARRFRRFPQFSLWASLLNRGALEIPAVALAMLHGPEVAGAFLLANRVVATPTRLVTESAYQVYVNEASRLHREAPENLHTLFVRTVRRLSLLSIPPALFLAVLGPRAFTLVFGAEWTEAGEYVRVLALVLIAMLVTQPVASTLWIAERQDLQLLREVARFVLVLVGFLAVWLIGASPVASVFAYTLAMTAGYALLLALCRSVVDETQARAVDSGMVSA